MRIFVFVNNVSEIGYRQTTALLIAAFYNQGHQVFLANVGDLSLVGQQNPGAADGKPEVGSGFRESVAEQWTTRLLARAFELPRALGTTTDSKGVADAAASFAESKPQQFDIQAGDLIFIRTNPGRDIERSVRHLAFLELCYVASRLGIRVVNEPAKLSFYASKSAVAVLPARFRPEMIVSSDPSSILEFVRIADCDCVLKPLVGSRGDNVIRVSRESRDVEKILSEKFEERTIVAQHFVPSDEQGDKRVVVLNGELIQMGNHLAGIHRVPARGEFRANLHAGGTAHPLSLSEDQREAAIEAAKILCAAGIQLAGIDLVGSKVIEFNVFSTGGLYDANRFAQADFAANIVTQLT